LIAHWMHKKCGWIYISTLKKQWYLDT